MNLRKIVTVEPFIDARSHDADSSKGLISPKLVFTLSDGDPETTQCNRVIFEVKTNWYPYEITTGFLEKGILNILRPGPQDVKAQGAGTQQPLATHVFDDTADLALGRLIEGGTDWLWAYLTDLFKERFGEPLADVLEAARLEVAPRVDAIPRSSLTTDIIREAVTAATREAPVIQQTITTPQKTAPERQYVRNADGFCRDCTRIFLRIMRMLDAD